MIKRSDISIKWKLLIYLLIFIAAAVAALWIFETALLNGFYTLIKTGELDEAAQNIEKSANNIADGDTEEFERRLLSEARRLNAQIALTDDSGNLIYFAGYGAPDKRDFADFDGKSEGGQPLRRGGAQRKDSRSEVIARSAQIQIGGQPYTVIIEAVIEPVSAAVTTLKVILVIITGMLIAAAFVLSRILYKKFATPIIETTRSALKLAEGNPDVDFNASGYSEINSLNDTLNYARREISKSEKLQREIIANFSHDLKTPLTLIGGYAEMLKDFPGERAAENAQVIIDEAARLNKLADDMLNLSKLNSGAYLTDMREFSVTDLIKTIARRYAELSKKDGLKIIYEPEDNIICTADESAISQVIYNLIANADIHGGKDKVILIEQKLEKGNAVFSFADNGAGINEDEAEEIWKRYKTGSGEKGRGSGLGLNIVSSILDLHGAEYGAYNRYGENNAQPKGAVFWFKLSGVKNKKD